MVVETLSVVKDEPDKELIHELEAALDLAKQGALTSVALIGDLNSGFTYTSFSTHDLPKLIGSVSYMHYILCTRLRENVV